VKAFQKDESYPEEKDPRNISTIDRVLKVLYCYFMYPVMDAFSTLNWYAFGDKPKDIAEKVESVCWGKFIETDFSRFDGTQNNVTRCLEDKYFSRVYSGENLERVRRLWSFGLNATGYTMHGVKYNTERTRLSGSPETACFNTLINAFVAFLAHRYEGKSVEDAYKALGYYGGDDGITPWDNDDTTSYSKAAEACGLKIKCAIKYRNPTFLGRYYYDGKFSFADIKRQLKKINIAVGAQNETARKQHLWNKWTGLLVTDPNTPILSDYCRAGLRILTNDETFVPKVNSNEKSPIYWASHSRENQFPQESYDEMFPHVLNALGKDAKWGAELIKHISGSESLDDLFDRTRIW
jgi:hypothetical protein